MHIPVVLMLALTGLGCQNKTSVVIDVVPLTSYPVDSAPLATHQGGGYSGSIYSRSFAPTPYPEIPSRIYNSDSEPQLGDWHAGLRSTLWSFVLGRDPDVNTVREIEASVYGYNSGQ